MVKRKKEKSTKELTKGLDKFFKGKELREDNAGAFEKAIKKTVKKKRVNKPSSK